MRSAIRPPAFLWLAAFVFLGAVPKPTTPPRPAARPPIARLEAAVEAEMERLGIPGLTAALVLNGQVEWTKGFGLADIENSVPASEDTVYRIASIAKPITATAVLQLVERGQINLDAPIQTYVPDYPEQSAPVTCRHLLAHQSGVRHVEDDEWGSTRHYTSIAETIDVFKDDPLLFTPGTKTEYSTYGFTLLGAAVERASETKFLDYLRENVFVPAGMESTRDDDVFAIIPRRAAGYRRLSTGELGNARLADTSIKIPGGGLCSTAADLARFAAAWQGDALLSKQTRRAAFASQKTRDGRKTGYGLGWLVGNWRGRREVWHHGGQPRVSTLLYMQPDKRLAIVFLGNLEGMHSALLELARLLSIEVAR
jgi:CubicO group peptidase (beta-lactamase class C family)